MELLIAGKSGNEGTVPELISGKGDYNTRRRGGTDSWSENAATHEVRPPGIDNRFDSEARCDIGDRQSVGLAGRNLRAKKISDDT